MKKGNDADITFSATKFVAFIIIGLAIFSHLSLELWPDEHWTVHLNKHGVGDAIMVALIASLDALAMWALGVYKWAKKNGAA